MSVETTADRPVVPPHRAGAWRAIGRGWPVFIPIIILEAAAQALLVVANPTPAVSPGFSLLVLGSAAALLVGVWLTIGAAVAAIDDGTRSAIIRDCGRRPVVLLWALAVGVVAVGAGLALLWLTPLVLLVGALVLPSAARSQRPVLSAALRPVTSAPLRVVLYLIATVLLAVLTWVVALLLGLFITGPLAAGITWLWFGLVATFVLCLSSSLDRS
jgi:hypothetical protein